MDTSIIELLLTDNNCCNEESIRTLNMTGFINLKTLAIASKCFKHVEKVWIVGLSNLESVIVGILSFVDPDVDDSKLKGSFTLKDCPKVKEFIIADHSFRGYRECTIENLPSLEKICLGDADDEDSSCNFLYAPLTLASRVCSFGLIIDLPKLTSVEFGRATLLHSQHIVFESTLFCILSPIDLPELQSIRMGFGALSFTPDGDKETSLYMKGSLEPCCSFVDLPKLTTITSTKEEVDGLKSTAFGLPKRVYLESTFLLNVSA